MMHFVNLKKKNNPNKSLYENNDFFINKFQALVPP